MGHGNLKLKFKISSMKGVPSKKVKPKGTPLIFNIGEVELICPPLNAF